jgi:quinoprotein glucose dehydrogenase
LVLDLPNRPDVLRSNLSLYTNRYEAASNKKEYKLMRDHSVSFRTRILLLGFVIASLCAASRTTAQQGTTGDQWISYGGDKGSTKYAPLDQITPDNFDRLKIAWQWESIDADVLAMEDSKVRPEKFEATPLMVNGVLYTSTSFSQVAAIDAATGETIWKHDPGSWRAGRPSNTGFVHRGVSYWRDGDDERIIIATGDSHLIALDAKTGKPIPSFGEDGRVNLLIGLNRPARISEHQVNSPPVICRDVIVTGCVISDGPRTKEFLRGDVRGFDVRTGEKLWQFVSIPQEGEPGVETWGDGSWKYSGNTNVWSLISADEDLGYVYLPFGAATNDYYGGKRPGDNLYANSLVCVNAETGERVWHFQTIHHDLWDYDLPCAPNLVDVVVDGKAIKAVAQMGKTGFCYVFDRVTGEPVWPIPEVPVPQSTVPGERTSPTQPMPTKPPPFSVQGVTEETVIDFTPELRQQALEIVKKHGFSPLFMPATEEGVFMIPHGGGGANWSGAALDPETSIIYVSSVANAEVLKVAKADPNRSNMGYHRTRKNTDGSRGPHGLPLTKPPYASITAIDLKTGTHAWVRPIGKGRENHPKLRGLNIPPTGGGQWGYPLATKSLVIVGKGNAIIALDKTTGERLGAFRLKDANGKTLGRVSGAPMTYLFKGTQYIVVAVTERDMKARLVALALP